MTCASIGTRVRGRARDRRGVEVRGRVWVWVGIRLTAAAASCHATTYILYITYLRERVGDVRVVGAIGGVARELRQRLLQEDRGEVTYPLHDRGVQPLAWLGVRVRCRVRVGARARVRVRVGIRIKARVRVQPLAEPLRERSVQRLYLADEVCEERPVQRGGQQRL
tara:strand:- start:13 stop:510 length:498 start_codon:yes stop_codon:yes gene_type:complete